MKELFCDDAVWDNEKDVPTSEDCSRRLAICGADWDNVVASDLFVLVQSILDGHSTGSGRKVAKVTIYPSDYGLEKIEREKTHGPEIDGVEAKPVDVDADESQDEDEDGEENA